MHGFTGARERLAAPELKDMEVPERLRRLPARGFKDGGELKAKLIRGPGTATSDSISAKKPAGTVIMPADSSEQLQDVRLSNGELDFPPDVVQAVGTAALLAMRDATHAPARGFNPTAADEPATQSFADGGLVEEERKRNSFGDAAALGMNASVAQIPTAGYRPAPDGNRVEGTEASRNIGNALSALPGAAPAFGAARTLGAARGFDTAAGAARSALGATAPYGAPIVGAAALSNASNAPAQPVPAAPTSPAAPTASAVRAPALGQASPGGAGAPAGGAPGANNITRTGNSYSGGPNITTDGLTINGREARGTLSVLPGAPASGLGFAGPQQAAPSGAQGQGFQPAPGTDWQSRMDMRNARVGLNSWKETDRERARAEVAQLSGMQLQGARNAGATDVANIRAGVDTAGQAIAQQDNQARQQLSAGRLGLDAATAGVDAQVRGNVLAAQRAYMTARTPQDRATALSTMQALQGQTQAQRFTVVPGGENDSGVRQASRVLNNQTGQFVDQPGAATALPAGMTRQVGTSGGKPVYEDGSGKRFIGN